MGKGPTAQTEFVDPEPRYSWMRRTSGILVRLQQDGRMRRDKTWVERLKPISNREAAHNH